MHKLKTWAWVLTANFAEGVPNTIVSTMLVVLLKDMGLGNGDAVMIPSLLTLPWMWKFAWSPVVDTHSTKRRWMLVMQTLIIAAIASIALAVGHSWWLPVVVAGSAVIALVGATYDIACDGHYMLSLNQSQQAFFVGIRSTAYRLGMLFVSGFLLIQAKDGSTEAWQRTLIIAAATIICILLILCVLLPKDGISPDTLTPSSDKPEEKRNLIEVLRSFIALHHGRELILMLLFIFTYRLGEAFLSKVTILFLKDDIANGGLALDNQQYGFLYGTFGTLSLVIGGIIGGMCISRWGLRRCLIPMVLALDVPDLLYVWLASMGWTSGADHLGIIGSCVSIEQFGYGFGFTAYTVYLLRCAKGPFETSHYAFLTALMSFGLLLPSTISGYIQDMVSSYYLYFIMACIITLPGIAVSLIVVKDLKE
ncbi:MAG: MFS transporter [Bacteroidales bacterium]|nr:MFS transporter [Candidatus Liminaster caballi]